MRFSRSYLSLLARLTALVLAECDPNASYQLVPYDGETSKDAKITSELVAYWSKNTCYKKSDGSEPNMKVQCKDVCFTGGGEGKGHVLSSQSCIFGKSPWSDARTGNPLLCGKDKTHEGKISLDSLAPGGHALGFRATSLHIIRDNDHDRVLLL
jgi:hypothetical protein